jgi:hypothetical protein
MISLTVDRAIPGDALAFPSAHKVRIRARAWAPAEIGAPELLEVVADGKVIRSAVAALDFTLDVGRSQWIAARATAENEAVAHTSPVYVAIGGKSFLDQSQVAELVAKRLAVLEFIEGRLRDAKYSREYGPGELEALRERIGEARREYRKLSQPAP